MDSDFHNPLLLLLDHRLALGVVGLDRRERVVSRNHAADALLDERDGLMLVRDRLAAGRHDEALALRRLVAGACAGANGIDAAGAVRISRTSPRHPVTVFVAPLRWSTLRESAGMPAAVVVMSDPDREPPRLENVLRRRYGLTRAETDVALLVLDGARAESVARQRGTSLNTARTHIKRVLSKVGVQSQVELVRMLLAGATPAGWVSPAAIGTLDGDNRIGFSVGANAGPSPSSARGLVR